jgi:hypothetical protein
MIPVTEVGSLAKEATWSAEGIHAEIPSYKATAAGASG